jgi:hypothetical protein
VKGNRWERDGKVNYFTNLDAWKIEKTSAPAREQNAPRPAIEDIPSEVDDLSDLPF